MFILVEGKSGEWDVLEAKRKKEVSLRGNDQWCYMLLMWWYSVLHSDQTGSPPAVQETWVGSLGREDSLEKRMATHSSILAWRVPWIEEPSGFTKIQTRLND